MNIRSKKLWAGTLAAGITATLGLTAITSSAPAENQKRGTPTISMEFDGNGPPSFSGPDFISPGSDLRILNNTDPREIGPHTFTLVKENLIPNSRDEFKACGRGDKGSVCRQVYKAHEVDFEKEEVGKRFVDSGKSGWNLLFRKQGAKGDSWFVDEEGDSRTETVSARPGKTLSYFCIIHPEMRGQIEVGFPNK